MIKVVLIERQSKRKKGEIKKMRSKKVWSILLVMMILSNFLSFLVPTNVEAAESTVKVYLTGKYSNNSRESAILREMNRERLTGSSLKIDRLLRATAYVRARELSVYYSHTCPDGNLSKNAGTSAAPFYYREYISKGSIAIDELSNPELYADYTNDRTVSMGHGNFSIGRTIL